ncbi:MAG TPA: NAD(P)H-quinone oxidoreductase [Terrimesophilobacter sp.]|jgi:putative NAD(P)H quinone oxidoreductase, PIG3 family|uniref:NAD(P)H-quinone oxidoreductase n=1 Tax=Terrimesophilobacter sp. TaxID=2906435 RepID=UPI002F944931
MRVVTIREPGGPEVLEVVEAPDPEPGHGEVLVRVAASGLNRADLHQRLGNYPPPAGAPQWPGLEVSGTVAELGSGVSGLTIGDRVCALLPGGGYAELAIASAGQILPVPDSVGLEDAAALPEAIATVWSNVFMTAALRAGETLLVHGGSSGVGTIAIQLARALGCQVLVTAGTAEKLEACRRLGAEGLINYREQDFVEQVLESTDGKGADVILDAIGGDYLDRNVQSLARHGRLVLIGNQSERPGRLSIGRLMSKWGSIHASTLRARPLAEKDEIMASVLANVWPLVAAGQVVPVIDARFAFDQAAQAHERMESSEHIGKLLLVP